VLDSLEPHLELPGVEAAVAVGEDLVREQLVVGGAREQKGAVARRTQADHQNLGHLRDGIWKEERKWG
jgi:hypothetical protein